MREGRKWWLEPSYLFAFVVTVGLVPSGIVVFCIGRPTRKAVVRLDPRRRRSTMFS